MRSIFASLTGLCLFGVTALAVPNNNGNSADQQWQSVKDKGNAITSDANSRAQTIATYLADADALKDFYTNNPTHTEAKEAKRREALSLLYARSLGEQTQKGRAKQLVKDLRTDPGLDAELREQLAAFSDNLDV